MRDNIKSELCISDFYAMLGEAMTQCGGGQVDAWKNQSIEEFARVFAQNGLRIVYMPDRHMDAVKIVWENPTTNTLPSKKQLLCDQLDKNGEYNPNF